MTTTTLHWHQRPKTALVGVTLCSTACVERHQAHPDGEAELFACNIFACTGAVCCVCGTRIAPAA